MVEDGRQSSLHQTNAAEIAGFVVTAAGSSISTTTKERVVSCSKTGLTFFDLRDTGTVVIVSKFQFTIFLCVSRRWSQTQEDPVYTWRPPQTRQQQRSRAPDQHVRVAGDQLPVVDYDEPPVPQLPDPSTLNSDDLQMVVREQAAAIHRLQQQQHQQRRQQPRTPTQPTRREEELPSSMRDELAELDRQLRENRANRLRDRVEQTSKDSNSDYQCGDCCYDCCCFALV